MSLLDNVQNPILINIKLYYTMKEVNGNKKIIILEDDKAEEILQDPVKAKTIETIDTFWKPVSWGEQRNLEISCTEINNETNEKSFNNVKFRDMSIKRCLKKWNLTMNGQAVEVSAELIDQLPADVIYRLYLKYNTSISYTDTELGN